MRLAFPDKAELRVLAKSCARVLVVTGSSGGHIFPALSFLDTLKEKQKNSDVLLVIPSGSIKAGILTDSCRIEYISISPIKLSLEFRNLAAIFGFLKGSLESFILLLKFRPEIVVGFGSLNCIPLVLLARLFRIKTLIHEQNVITGRANRLLARFSDRIAVSFPETRDYLKVNPKRIVLTGNPIRRGLKRIDKGIALSFFGFDAGKLTVLVAGGSQGSHRINMSFLKAVSMIGGACRMQVIHLTGVNDYDILNKSYGGINTKAKLFTFLKEMQYAYSAADLVISRAGATTVSELISFRLPAIIVPYQFAYKHQLSNAQVLERMGTAIIINDNELDAGILRRTLLDFMNNPRKIDLMRSRYDGVLVPDANTLLVDAAIS
jgi:UDP-N-acetylglucosamine--N-acetylmuramyl-(pentapeptide) pyrophosphoryl-undecaprenol N-acetylglucosamine transferase